MLATSEATAITQLHDYNLDRPFGGGGYDFSLMMRCKETGNLIQYDRDAQPCYGELRKYKKTHGEACTQPNDSRPTDLHDPFPEGIVEGLAVSFSDCRKPAMIEQHHWMLSDASPWRRGFGSSADVEFTTKGATECGIVLKNTDVDATVLVNLLKLMHWTSSSYTALEFLQSSRELGFDELQSQILCSSFDYVPWDANMSFSNTYIWPMKLDVKRFITQDPIDFSGGTWRDGWDYSRKQMANIFAGAGTGLTLAKVTKETMLANKKLIEPIYKPGMSYQETPKRCIPQDFYGVVKEILDKELSSVSTS